MAKETPEHTVYKIIELWQPYDEIILVEELSHPKTKDSALFSYIYHKAKEAYQHFPRRKDNQDPFIHPINIVCNLKKAEITDIVTLGAALLHDYIEEKVDLYKKEQEIKLNEEGIMELEKYELGVFKKLNDELSQFCKKNRFDQKIVKQIMPLLQLLTRHKRHFYYRSISNIFNCKDEKVKEKAVQIKLADRIHNIQCLSAFNDQEKIFQCFKNFFILNNTKRYLLKKYGITEIKKGVLTPTGKLFIKCCKSTFDAFLTVCRNSIKDEQVAKVESLLQLAFRKFAHEHGGIWKVTSLDKKEKHLMCLYHEIIRKYDARLHQEWERFEKMKNYEIDYCKKFFTDYNFSQQQIQAIINYKDAYALKEAVARLIYKPNYFITGFGCSELCSRGMVCMKI